MAIGGNTAYDDATDLPDPVRSAVAVASAQLFDHSCAPEQGRLLALLVRGWSGGRIGETGTGCGVGLAWMVDAAGPDTEFVSIELDGRRAAASANLFAAHRRVEVVQGSWARLVKQGPFDLLVLDGGGKGKDPDVDTALDPTAGWLSLGGTIVLDDFTPAGAPRSTAHDRARDHWLNHPALRTTEIRLTSTLATLVGTRVQ